MSACRGLGGNAAQPALVTINPYLHYIFHHFCTIKFLNLFMILPPNE